MHAVAMGWGNQWEAYLRDEGLLEDASNEASTSATRKRGNPEEKAQIEYFKLCTLHARQYPALHAVHASQNGLYSFRTSVARAKRAGLKLGVSDIHLPAAGSGYIGLWIELKIEPNTPTEAQLEWIDRMRELGHYACVAYGWEEAWNTTLAYLNDELDPPNHEQ